MNKKILKKARKLNDKELRKIIEVFDTCMECWNLKKPEDCEYRKIRLKIGLGECNSVKMKKIIERRKKERDKKEG